MNLWKVSTIALIGILGAVSVGFVRPALAAFNQPRMHAAEDSLRAAREHLVHGEHDKGWHRDRAIQAVDQAIAEVHAGIIFADEHP